LIAVVAVLVLVGVACDFQGTWGGAVTTPAPTGAAPTDDLRVVACVPNGACVAAGRAAALRTGSQWTALPTPPAEITSLACASVNDCLGGWSDGALPNPSAAVYHFDGSTWSKTSCKRRSRRHCNPGRGTAFPTTQRPGSIARASKACWASAGTLSSALFTAGSSGEDNTIRVQVGTQIVRVVAQEPGALGITQLAIVKSSSALETITDDRIEQVLSLVSLGDPSPEAMTTIDAFRRIAKQGN
jgi:hypothetical protein